MTSCLRDYWPEYVIEGAGSLARVHDFRIRIHRASDASGITCDALDRGPGMEAGGDGNRHELNGIALIYSPWGTRSCAPQE